MKLPSNLNWKRLSEVCEKPEYGYTTSAEPSGEGPRFLRTTDISSGEINWGSVPFCKEPPVNEEKYRLKNGDILIARAGTIGASAVIKDPPRAIFASYLIRFRPKTELDPAYAGFFLKSKMFWLQLGSKATGTTLLGVNATNLANVQIPIFDLPTQQKIASILETCEAAMEKRREANRLTDEFLKSAFLEMFGDPIKNNKKLEFKSIESLAADKKYSIKRVPFGGSLKKEIFVPSGYKVYEQKHAIYNNFKLGTYYINEAKYKEMLPFAIEPDDLIISCSGTIGKIAIVPGDAEPGIINQALLKITLDKSKALPIYFKYLFESDSAQKHLFGFTYGTAMRNVTSIEVLRKIKLPIALIQRQQNFTDLVEKVENLKQKQRGSEKELDNLFNSLMQRAFKGELKV